MLRVPQASYTLCGGQNIPKLCKPPKLFEVVKMHSETLQDPYTLCCGGDGHSDPLLAFFKLYGGQNAHSEPLLAL